MKQTIPLSRLGALAAASFALLSGGLGAQEFTSSVLTKGLTKPTGIVVEPNGDIVFTELPQPGKSGGNNTVNRYVAKTGKVALIVKGEPAPTNIARTSGGDLYWTCVTAGVLVRKLTTSSSVAVFKSGLSSPTGIAINSKGTIFVTQVPTPGKSGSASKNKVSMLSGSKVIDLSTGEPDPWDVVADADGNIYWTCRAAGVILRRDAKSGKKTFVLKGLRRPHGIAMDAAGNLYFTEVPTPGKTAANGGSNAVWRYSPATRNLTLVDYGDPEPTDVTVSADGKNVYWTCTTAGVIKRAVRGDRSGTVLSTSTTKVGDTVKLTFSAPKDGNLNYVAASSADRGPLPIGARYIALALDPVFSATFLINGGPATGYFGKLDNSGKATASLKIPSNIPGLKGLSIYTAFVTLDSKGAQGIGVLSSSLRFVIE